MFILATLWNPAHPEFWLKYFGHSVELRDHCIFIILLSRWCGIIVVMACFEDGRFLLSFLVSKKLHSFGQLLCPTLNWWLTTTVHGLWPCTIQVDCKNCPPAWNTLHGRVTPAETSAMCCSGLAAGPGILTHVSTTLIHVDSLHVWPLAMHQNIPLNMFIVFKIDLHY